VIDGRKDNVDGATPLTEDEREGLLPAFVSTRNDLNVVEHANITAAAVWARRSRRLLVLSNLLDDGFVRALHQRMFGRVWSWAGKYRLTERTIGVDPVRIAVDVRSLVEDATFWFAPGVGWISPERAVLKLHHRMVQIHPFPNGNGRHARLYADVVSRAVGVTQFSWGSGRDLGGPGTDRAAYVSALRAADRDPEDLGPLEAFAMS
jgi:Fic-DOC domain mobile mystery protein B